MEYFLRGTDGVGIAMGYTRTIKAAKRIARELSGQGFANLYIRSVKGNETKIWKWKVTK